MSAGERQDQLVANLLHLGLDLIRIDAFGRFPGKAKQNGAIGSVAAAGEGKRTVEVDHDADDAIELLIDGEFVHEAMRRAHRPDRVRTRRPEANLKEIEGAYEHCLLQIGLSRRDAKLVNCNSGVAMKLSRTAIVLRATATLMACLLATWPVQAEDAGWQAYRRGDYQAARSYYESAARNGDRLAQYNLATMLLRGEGGAENLEAGVGWLTKAAEAGMAQAQYNLGLLFESGIGVSRDLTMATAWWQKAAEQGHTQAQVELATQYFLGRGAPKDWKIAARWYEAAAANGDPGAQYIIGSFYEHGDGVSQDLKKALEWYTQAAARVT